MTTKRTSLFRFFLKTVLVVLGLALTAVLVMNGWSWWELKQTRKNFEKATGYQETEMTTRKLAHGLIAVSKIGEGIEWTKDERIAVSTASSLACQDWTPEQLETVRLVVKRNNNIGEAVSDAIGEPPQPAETVDPDHKSFLPMLYLARLITAEARLSLADGNQERFLKALGTLRAVNIELDANPDLTNTIFSDAIHLLTNQVMLDHLTREDSGRVDTPFLKQCQAAIPEPQISRVLRAALIGDYTKTSKALNEACQSTPDGGIIKVLIHPIVTPILCRLIEAARIDVTMSCLDLIDRPFGLQPEAFEQPPRPSLWKIHRAVAEIGRPNTLNTIARTQAIAAQRQLLDAALTMRTTQWPDGAFPETRPNLPVLTEPDPFSVQLRDYRLLDDGRLHLDVAGGPKLLKALKRPGPQNWLDPVVLDAPATE